MSESGQSESWFVGEDGILTVKDQVEDVVFLPSLNVVLVTTRAATVHVLDVTSGAVFHSSDLSADPGSSIRCAYLSSQDRVVFASDYAVGTRRDLNGMLLLESALQLPVSKQDDIVCVELPLPDAIHLNQCLLGADLPGVDHVMDVLRLLDKEISAAQEAARHNHKLAKWSTVCLKLSHTALKTVFSSLLTEVKRLQQKVPALPVVSALLDRLNYLHVSAQSDSNSMVSAGTADRALMYSEAARLETFSKWPHLNYKWALPEPMAQAGFYYQPSTTGDDRAMCFTCNVCLVCWEPTDEPWSEHERHSPQCPFVKGEFTQNVPVSVTYATEPAQLHRDQTEKIECLSTSSSSKFFATSNSKGGIVVWNSSSQLKKHVTFEVELQNPVITSKLGAVGSQVTLQSVITAVRDKDAQDKSSDPSSSSSAASVTENANHQVATTSKESMELPVPPEETASLAGHRTASSLKVTALSVIVGAPSELVANHAAVAAPRTTQDLADIHPSLVAGIFIQVNSPAKDESPPVTSVTTWQADRTKFSEVQVLNQLNQAISGETPPVQIICSAVNNQEGSACDTSLTAPVENGGVHTQHYIPCLVIYDVSAAVAPSVTVRELKNEPTTFQGTQVTKPEFSDGLSSAIQSVYSIKEVEMSDDDQDIQIIGVSGPVSPTAPKIINLTYDTIPGTTYKVFGSNFHQSKEGKIKETEITDTVCPSGSLTSAGHVVQCIPLPPEVESTQFVRCIVPVNNKSHIIVITSPVSTRTDLSCFADSVIPGDSHSCILIYQVVVESGVTMLSLDPVSVLQFDDLDDAVMTATLLPPEVCLQSDDDDDDDAIFENSLVSRAEELCGAVVITTYSGDIKILNLSNLSVLAVIKATSNEAYISTTYCSSIDRLCASTRDGRLRFFIVGPKQRHLDELDGGHVCLNSFVIDDGDSVACGSTLVEQKTNAKRENFILNEQLTVEVLAALHDLTLFENLLPRFSATVPPCWTEIQQEQQQRKHPQHLHQQGEATQHTRTWRLQADSTSWDEHLFELVLPRLLCVGHIDLKFTLNAMCTSVPNIQVTLLKQSMSSIGQSDLSAAKPLTTDAGARVDFNLRSGLDSDVGNLDGATGSQAADGSLGDSGCLGSEFLERHRSEIVCGPLELANYVDLSGTQGIIPLTSIQLLKSKSKSFLLHIKSKSSAKDRASAKPTQNTVKNTIDSAKAKPALLSNKPPGGSPCVPGSSMSGSANKQKVESIRGCDWLHEVSITVRRFRKSSHHRDRVLRYAMLESVDFHERLLLAACGQDDISTVSGNTCKEHRQHLALDILTWIMAIQINDAGKMQLLGSSLMQTLQSNLSALVQSCLLEADRSVAHKCAKLIALCLEYVKNCSDPDFAPAFNYILLQALIECLPHILTSYSAGALHWYFTLLNHVKCMDASSTGEKCMELLGEIAKSYSCRVNPYHSLLRARYGLYGSPLEPDLFDIDPPQLRTAPATNTTYSGVVASTVGANTGGVSAGGIPLTAGTGLANVAAGSGANGGLAFSEDVLFKDLMNLCHMDKNISGPSGSLNVGSTSRSGAEQPLSRYLTGLLEVEPLHFTCHATSDGTRMERLDTLNQTTALPGNAVGLSGTINFAEGLSSTTGTMLSTLSSAMVSAEQQLVQLQQKQLQLIKLQQQKQKLEQKLAETTKNVASGSAVHLPSHYMSYGSELFPPTPKNTPFFMTPPVTPPNESYHGMFVGGSGGMAFGNDKDVDKPPSGKANNSSKIPAEKNETSKQLAMLWPQTQTLFQPPPAQALVIERMHSGARRFVVLDFGKAILLTDVVIPMCGDLASLSIDIWIQGEEIDGHRLVVSSDIGLSSLILNDIMPPPVCRYLKITTIRRYGGNTTRSKIPIGSFYGHTFILPWEKVSIAPSHMSPGPCSDSDRSGNHMSSDQSQILSQLGMYMSLLEDVQCRYSLACKNLITLLSAADVPGNESSNHTQFFLKKGRRTDDDNKIHLAYCECIQLQVQLNLAKHATTRLQKVLGIYNYPSGPVDLLQGNLQLILRQTSVDKLRVLIEFLLDTLLSMTNSCPTIPQMPVSLYTTLTPTCAEMLFRNLCIHGTKKMQTHTGVILVRVCGTQSWWGEFLGNILQEFFTAEQLTIFPQDRVFILLAALGQRSLTGPAASSILENILLLLARQLSPLSSDVTEPRRNNLRHLDLTLIGWLLLFLSKCLDCCQSNASDDMDKAPSKDREGRWCFPGSVSSRWNFIQGENAVQVNKLSKSNTSKLYRRKLQKRLLHHKQQLMNLQQAKKHFSSKMEESVAAGSLMDKETEHLVKTQDMLFKRQMRQYSSKHLKDIINIRRTDGEMLRKQTNKESGGSLPSGEKDSWESDIDSSLLVMSREKCIPVVHGLVTLLLSMDFTCHVDLFIIACKVLARVTVSTRPAISLSEAMKQEDLEQLMLLMCNLEYNHGNVSWGGSWSGHSITCLLQDILEGERLYSVASQMDGNADGEMLTPVGAGAAADTASNDVDDSLLHSCSLPTMEEEPAVNDSAGKNKYDMDVSMLVDALMDDELYEEQMSGKYTDLKDFLYTEAIKSDWTAKLMNVTMKSNPNSSTIHWGFTGNPVFGDDDKKDIKLWKSKNASFNRPMNAAPQGVSLAMDARLEQGVELRAELRLKLMLSMEANNIHNAMNAPLPLLTLGAIPKTTTAAASSYADERLSDDSFASLANRMEAASSLSMLSTCFNHLFSQLHLRRINLDVLLQIWLTLNDETAAEDNGGPTFDPARVPIIALDQSAVSSLLAALAWSPSVSARTWVLAFQTLTLMANIKQSNDNGLAQGGAAVESANTASHLAEKWLASFIITDNNLMTVLVKFLSGSGQQTSVTQAVQNAHIGPIVVQSFHKFLIRLQLRCGEDENRLKEVLLRLVLSLSAEGGAFHLFLGPLDAQYRLIEDICELNFPAVDVNTAISILESISALVHRHIMSQERAQCRSTIENSINARSVYVGLFSNVLRTNENKSLTGDANQDLLMCSLLRLASLLVKIPLPRRQASKTSNVTIAVVDQAAGARESNHAVAEAECIGSPQTDFSKMSHSLGTSGMIMTSTPNLPGDGVTDEQKTETARSAAGLTVGPTTSGGAPIMSIKMSKTCSHSAETATEPKSATLADIVLGHRQIMLHLMESLGCCNTNTIAMILASSELHSGFKQNSVGENPLSVGDGIFNILLTLNSKASKLSYIVKPVYEYLSSELHGFSASVRVSRLSEPLLWFVLRVLDCQDAIHSFLDMGGVEVICQNLVSTNRHIIDTSPSLVSAIMQYFGTARPINAGLRRGAGGADSADNLQNFAPLGTISSTSPTANPADVLIHGTAPHRRARSAAWTYHYYPDEAWVDLTISLPCAILLKEVNIQPHLTSLATCPAAVTVEGSRDGTHMVPICPPTSTSGLTNIKIQLLREEVVTAVTMRLHKPRDSHAVGLAQITLMGYMAFGDTGAARTSSSVTPSEDYVSRTSIGWLRLLHHCVSQCDDLQKDVTQAAVSTPDLLITCTTLLMTSSAVIYANSIESVLLTIGLHSTAMGLALLDHLLRNTSLSGTEDGGQTIPSFYNRLNGRANESTVDILYQLGTNQDAGLTVRLKAFTDWLGDCARLAIQKSHSASDDAFHHQGTHRSTPVSLASPAVIHVHCVAVILWYNNEMAVTDDLRRIVTRDLLSAMYEWSMALATDSLLKQAVDSVICSLCYIHPHFFSLLLEWMGIVIFGGMESYTDDHKDSQHSLGPLTDDLKADPEARSLSESRTPALDYRPYILQDISHVVLEESHLFTLALACQSSAALRQLLESGFVMMLCQGLYEVSSRELRQHEEPMVVLSEASTDAVKMAMDGAGGVHAAASSDRQRMFSGGQGPFPDMTSQSAAIVMTADTVAPVLKFLAELSQEVMMKDWLGGPDGRIFWSVLLKSLCTSSTYVLVRPSHQAMTNEQRSAIETATINFFSKVISCHAQNQLQFSLVVHNVIQSYDSGSRGCPSPLPGFLRRLFLQVLLEDEKLLVCISSQSQMYKGSAAGVPLTIQHPRFGVGHKYRTIVVSLQATCGEILSKISETQSLASAQVLEDQEKVVEEMKKDASELGIEVIDQISALAGLKAKEKREKDMLSALQRPPSRLGTRSGDRTATPATIPVMALYHLSLPDQPLPSELNMSQLLSVLYEQGVAHGQTFINLLMKHIPQMADGSTDESRIGRSGLETVPEIVSESCTSTIPSVVLLQTPNFTSALQVFSSIGGLALLAEHLPLLYPEFSRQSTPAEMTKDTTVPGGIGQDWVTVESSEDIYEEIYEPAMPPSPPVQHKPASISTSQVQSIPPHSLVAFGLFLRLPGYAEVLLKDKRKAQCLLRLVLGVTDDGEGGHILTSLIAPSLPSLPFNVLKSLFDSMPLTTDDGVMLRRMTLEIGAIHLILACLSVLGHHAPRHQIPGFYQDIIKAAMQATQTVPSTTTQQKNTTEEKSQNYWAKGTGFGTGSTTSSWDAEHALLRQKSEEEHVTCLLQVLASYINPGGIVANTFVAAESSVLGDKSDDDRIQIESSPLPPLLPELLIQSCLVPALSSYLRNDSVLDMACHVPLYRALLELLRAMAVCPLLVPLLLPLDKDDELVASVSSLLDKMKQCVDTYASRLKGNRHKTKSTGKADDDESEGLALLIPDIQKTAQIVSAAVEKVSEKSHNDISEDQKCEQSLAMIGRMNHSEEERYMSIIKQLQFDTFKMVTDDNNIVQFAVPHHYESNVKAAGDVSNAARARRLAQEAVTLSTSLPLSASSSVFVRCDEERLDVMKVMMTGPSDTPYGNGCFEFDVYFPTDYPNSPPLINLETTGNHTVRFNPNLYNDGKVCLSILNTWHGRPEEKWNSQTSSFLQVLVSIQSLILVSEPYFNEPGYERSRGTPSGTASSREYDANIRQATVKWAMLEMLRNPPASFKTVIQWHFWLKKNEILSQVEEWMTDLESYSSDKRVGRSIAHSSLALKRHYSQLKEELSKLKPPVDTSSFPESASFCEEAMTTSASPPSPQPPPPQMSSDVDTGSLQTTPTNT